MSLNPTHTDALWTWGCAAVLESEWLQWKWPPEWCKVGIMAMELVSTYIIWVPYLAKLHINLQCENASLVIVINKGSSKDKFVIHLLCSLSFFVAHFDIYITAFHLPGIMNVTADHLSRGYMSEVFEATPTLAQHPTATSPLDLN